MIAPRTRRARARVIQYFLKFVAISLVLLNFLLVSELGLTWILVFFSLCIF